MPESDPIRVSSAEAPRFIRTLTDKHRRAGEHRRTAEPASGTPTDSGMPTASGTPTDSGKPTASGTPTDSTASRPTFVVAIDGKSGAGKTTLAGKLEKELCEEGIAAAAIEVESFIGGWNGLIDGVEAVASRILEPVRSRGSATARSWDWKRGAWADEVRIPQSGPVDVLILTGCGAASAPCRPFVDVAVWLELDEERRRKRVARREGDPGRWWLMWAEQEDLLPRSGAPDVVVAD